MQKIDDVIVQQLKDLIKEGKRIVGLAESASSAFRGDEVARTTSWVSKCGNIIQALCGENSVYYGRFSSILDHQYFYNIHSNNYKHLGVVLGCVEAVNDDLKIGLLQNIKVLLRAEIFGDFLEMAEYLLKEGYKDAAAVLIGAVLEDSLRKLSIREGISIEKDDGSPKALERLNQELYKAEAYDKLIQKQVTSWGDLRNKAAHGEFDKYDKDQVQMMLLFVQKFCSDHIS